MSDPDGFRRHVEENMNRIQTEHEEMRARHADPDFLRKQVEDDSARELAAVRHDPAIRIVHARAALLRWVYEFQAGRRVLFQKSSHAALSTGRYRNEADFFTSDETASAAQYLATVGLIELRTRTRDDGKRARVHHLTEAGAECVEHFGGNVAKYRDAQRRGGTSIKIDRFTGNFATGDHATQHHGVQPAAMAGFVGELMVALKTLDIEPADRIRAEAALAEVQREVERSDPDTERVHGAFGRFVQGLANAAPKAITELMLMFARGYMGPTS
jgi:hypothetical protein